MGRYIQQYHPNAQVRFELINRSKHVRLADIIPWSAISKQLREVRSLQFNRSELHWLRGTNEYQDRMFPETYLSHLDNLVLPEWDLSRSSDDNYIIRVSGLWKDVTYWETYILSIVNELRFHYLTHRLSLLDLDAIKAKSIIRLKEKVDILKKYPQITFSDFGTRRRVSYDWQYQVNEYLANELSGQFLGTSNAKIAMDLGLLPMGTNAHELQQVVVGQYSGSASRMQEALKEFGKTWATVYGKGLRIALPDTFGTDAFLKYGPTDLPQWKGFRHDSGDPYVFANKIIDWYKQRGEDPKQHIIVFSDSLTVETIVKLWETFHDQIQVTFGWGTDLTFDLGGEIAPISIVCKVTEVDGHAAVKLSDNIAKAVGPALDIEYYKQVFGYTNTYSQLCRT